MTTGAFAASLTGKIWTNKPAALGIGYYCTAAQNTGAGSNGQYANAKSMNSSGTIIASASQTGNNQAVANSGATKPNSGYGEYGETGGKSYMNFSAGAYE